MNCKQGDLAIIVKSDAGNEGKIVRCVRYLGCIAHRLPGGGLGYFDAWEIDIELPAWDGKKHKKARDIQLRPIRGDLLNDETTTSKELEAV